MTASTTYVGIDPGITGAIAALRDGVLELRDMPTMRDGKKRAIDVAQVAELVALLSLNGEVRAMLERQQAMPKQGVASMFQTGYGYGVLVGCLTARKMPHEIVTPAVWKRDMRLDRGKDAARAAASRLFPASAPEWAAKAHHGRAEAALLAEYARRRWGG